MPITIQTLTPADHNAWDEYVLAHPHSTVYHLSGWKNIIEKTYYHKTYYLFATNPTNPSNSSNRDNRGNPLAGILPLVHLKHIVFGNHLFSIPFFDTGGILADDAATEDALLQAAIKLARKLKAGSLELRHLHPLQNLNISSASPTNPDDCLSGSLRRSGVNKKRSENLKHSIVCETQTHKVRMLLALPESSQALMKTFKSKLRSQIRKPVKEGLSVKIGGVELLTDFYRVFAENMRDLGSPVHAKDLMKNVLREFPASAGIVMVYQQDTPLAGSVIVGHKDTLANPWASARRKYSHLSPNMLLYWSMLEHGCRHAYRYFDFGRSTPGEGTYRFKKQWGAVAQQLHWQFIFPDGKPAAGKPSQKEKFGYAVQYWQKIPVPLSIFIGPRIRKHIGL